MGRRLDLEVPEVESVCLEIFADNRKFVLVCLYRPPNARVSSWDYIDNLFDKCVDSGISNCTMVTTKVWKYIAISNYVIIIDQYRIN
jgi:hypothetical protein